MAKKIYAILNRNRNKGRNFYDLVFLMGRDIKPNYRYLEAKISISGPESLKEVILNRCNILDMDAMAKDVEPFLFEATDVKKVVHFTEVVQQYEF